MRWDDDDAMLESPHTPSHLPFVDALFVLGAADPEMLVIEALLTTHHVLFVHARHAGKRVYPANAYQAALPAAAVAALAQHHAVYLVECVGDAPNAARRIDHHRPGDAGYGLPPAHYWEASSLGQTVRALHEDLGLAVEITPTMRLTAAADHCLGAAYRGACPGINPVALLDWHIASRAAFEHRAESAVRRDIERTRQTLREAPHIALAPNIEVLDMRGVPAPELLVAGACEGRCFLSAIHARDGRIKIGCLVGSPPEVAAFMQVWAPAQGLTDIYGDPARGFAGAYQSV